MKGKVLDVSLGAIKHRQFGEPVLADIRSMQAAFQEHDPLSIEEWEDGFRRAATEEREIALWLRTAEIYRGLAADDPSPVRRLEVYGRLIVCMVTPPDPFFVRFPSGSNHV